MSPTSFVVNATAGIRAICLVRFPLIHWRDIALCKQSVYLIRSTAG